MPIVRKAIFPAAGLGTRFLPVTKAQPKEMLPLVDKPTIQYGVEEAIASGIEQVIMVTGGGKRAIVDHFDRSLELEHYLRKRGREDLLAILARVDRLSDLVDITYIQQKEPLGLGHAVWTARRLVEGEACAVLLADYRCRCLARRKGRSTDDRGDTGSHAGTRQRSARLNTVPA